MQAGELTLARGGVEQHGGGGGRATPAPRPGGGCGAAHGGVGVGSPLTVVAGQVIEGGPLAVPLAGLGPVGRDLGGQEVLEHIERLCALEGAAPTFEAVRAVEVLEDLVVAVVMVPLGP